MQISEVKTVRELALFLDVQYSTLIYYLYKLPPEKQYTQIAIPKKRGGVRHIRIPISPIKLIQSKLAKILTTSYIVKPSAHGFVKNRSIVTNAKSHCIGRNTNYVLNLDLKDFFPSINFGRVRGMFMAYPYHLSPEVSTALAKICCVDNELPQGAPTSPIVSNMICSKLDSELQRLAKKYRCTYSRYADDITISSSLRNFPRQLAYFNNEITGEQLAVGYELEEIIIDNGFQINISKVRLTRKDRRQQVTGIIINKKTNLNRQFYSQIRAMLHAWEKYNLEDAQREHLERWRGGYSYLKSRNFSYASVVRGKIEYLGMVRGKNSAAYIKFMTKLKELDPNVKFEGGNMRDKLFICYSHRDKKQVEAIQNHLKPYVDRDLIWYDADIKPGEKWYDEIQNAINSAKAALFLLSTDFLNSDFIKKVEIPSLLDAAKKDGVVLLILPIKHTNYERSIFKDYQALCDVSKPLSTMRPELRERKLVEISEKILKILEQ